MDQTPLAVGPAVRVIERATDLDPAIRRKVKAKITHAATGTEYEGESGNSSEVSSNLSGGVGAQVLNRLQSVVSLAPWKAFAKKRSLSSSTAARTQTDCAEPHALSKFVKGTLAEPGTGDKTKRLKKDLKEARVAAPVQTSGTRGSRYIKPCHICRQWVNGSVSKGFKIGSHLFPS